MSATSGRTDGGAMAKAQSGFDVSDPAIHEAWKECRDNSNASVTWVLLHVEGNKRLTLKAKGSGHDAFLAALSADDITWGAFKGGHANVTPGDITSGAKFYGICCVGDNVSGMAKSKQMMYKNAIMNCFEGKVGEVVGQDMDEFREKLAEIGKVA